MPESLRSFSEAAPPMKNDISCCLQSIMIEKSACRRKANLIEPTGFHVRIFMLYVPEQRKTSKQRTTEHTQPHKQTRFRRDSEVAITNSAVPVPEVDAAHLEVDARPSHWSTCNFVFAFCFLFIVRLRQRE